MLAAAFLILRRCSGKVDVNAESKSGAQPIHHAAASSALEAVAWLVSVGGANPDARSAKGSTPLHFVRTAVCTDAGIHIQFRYLAEPAETAEPAEPVERKGLDNEMT